ncbi:MAG: serine hydrolase [Chitinophagaceae bacterium]|nr:serine hydrolase [Chitinophagaceae bacterium]
MKRILCFAMLMLIFGSYISAQKTDRKLYNKVQLLLKNFNGDVGVCIKSLKTNKIVSINADTIFPTASIVKIPILIGIMDKINKKEFEYHQQLVYRDTLAYSQYDVTTNLKDSAKIEMAKVIMLMLTTSDNTASLWLQKLAGTGTRINEILDSAGFKVTRVNSRTTGREENRTQYGWGQTTPYEMASLMEKIYNGQIISDSISKKMIRLLGRNFWDEQAISSIPPTVFVASKNGAVDASRSEVLLVMAKEPYIFSIFTKNNKDKSWGNANEAWMLAKNLSALLWKYYGE